MAGKQRKLSAADKRMLKQPRSKRGRKSDNEGVLAITRMETREKLYDRMQRNRKKAAKPDPGKNTSGRL